MKSTLVTFAIVAMLFVSMPSSVAADRWTEFGKLIAKYLGMYECMMNENKVVDAVVQCYDEYDTIHQKLSDHEMSHEAGCCLYGRFQHCVKHRVDKLCTKAAANVTEIAINYLRIFVTSECKEEKPEYPSLLCDEILFPEQTLVGVLGLILGFLVFGLMVTTITFLTCTMVRRRGYESYISV